MIRIRLASARLFERIIYTNFPFSPFKILQYVLLLNVNITATKYICYICPFVHVI